MAKKGEQLAQAVSLLDACGIKTDVYNQVEADQDNLRSAESPSATDNAVGSPFGDAVHAEDDVLPLALSLEACGTNSTVAGFVRLLAR